jgi:phospholipase/lecithinase/hemolysin
VATSATGCTSRVAIDSQSFAKGDSNYLGTEINGGFTWRFAPNAAFDMAAYYLFAGSALDQTELLNGVAVKRDSRDGYYAAARVRLSF